MPANQKKQRTEAIRIAGMTCVNCQRRVERALRGTPGVLSASVSYRDSTATIVFDETQVTLERLKDAITELGYRVSAKNGSFLGTCLLLVTILLLYILTARTGALNLLVPSRLAESGMGYGTLFVLGLITSVHCIAMCGGINLSQALPRDKRAKNTFSSSLLYNVGRVVSYTAIGALLGGIGGLAGLGGTGMSALLQGCLKLFAGAVMVLMGLNMLGIFPSLRKWQPHLPRLRQSGGTPFAVGLLNGLMPCGPLQSIQIVALASGSMLTGALTMLLFSLGTVPLMLGFGSLVAALGKKFTVPVMRIGSILVTAMGLAMLSQGGALSGLFNEQMLEAVLIVLTLVGIVCSIPSLRARYKAAISAAVCAAAVWSAVCYPMLRLPTEDGVVRSQIADGVQTVSATLLPGQYPSISVVAGIPVEWTIHAPSGSINGCNYKILSRDFGFEYTFHEGDNRIAFTPTAAGTYTYSCWMGMIRANIIVRDE